MTTFQYDDDGRLVSSVMTREPEFSPWDRAVLLSDRASAGARRGPHGVLESEATDPANQFAYEVPPPITDHAQVALSKAKEEWRKANPNADASTRLWRVQKRT